MNTAGNRPRDDAEEGGYAGRSTTPAENPRMQLPTLDAATCIGH
jgi:hypothetical protein